MNSGIKFILSTRDTKLWITLYGFLTVRGMKWNRITIILFRYTMIEWIIIYKQKSWFYIGREQK